MDQSLSKQRRVTRGREFDEVIRRGACAADGVLVVFASRSIAGRDGSRLGVTIPKRAGTAVTRNLWKRLIRESYRTQRPSIPAGYDFVIRPKKGAHPNWAAIKKSVPALARRAARRGQRKTGSEAQRD